MCSAIVSCAQQQQPEQKVYPEHVGDIAYDPELDDVGFKVCNPQFVLQYYNFGKGFQFNGEKKKILDYFQARYTGTPFKGESGYISIRFIVNCEGNTGRFRVIEMDMDYQSKKFSRELHDTLLDLTTKLTGWPICSYETPIQVVDYYQYLLFKIEDGAIKEILP